METYFGLQIKVKKGQSAQDIVARLFLHPRISSSQVKSIIDLLGKKRLSYESLINMTNEGIAELRRWKDEGEDIPAIMNKKYDEWNSVFHAPDENDYDYIEKTYGISKSDLLGSMVNTVDIPLNNARDVEAYLKRFIKGQDKAITNYLSVPIWQHIHSKLNNYTSRVKPSILLLGPTGCGKTALLSAASNIFKSYGCPVVHINATQFSATGWRGDSIYDIIARDLFGKEDSIAVKTPDAVKYAVLIIDEIDKITSYGCNNSGNNNIEIEALAKQGDLMHLLDFGQTLKLKAGGDNIFNNQQYELPLDNLLIIFSGCFDGIENIIRKRLNIHPHIGFSESNGNAINEENDILNYVSSDDLKVWGFIPEFLGRIDTIVTMNHLSTDDIYNIMLHAEGSVLKSHVDYCLSNNVDLNFSEEALYYIASQAFKTKMGFRNVKSILSAALIPLYHDFPEETKRRIEINKEYVINCLRHNNCI